MGIAHGAAFGGGVGLLACCDWVIASEDARFCLSEVRVGVVAAVILPYVAQKIGMGHLRRFVLAGRIFSAEDALRVGLAQKVFQKTKWEETLADEVKQVLLGSAEAQKTFKSVHSKLVRDQLGSWKEQEAVMVDTIARLRVSESGQKGLEAFLTKQQPDWAMDIPNDWKAPFSIQ
jgi:methylglutaconyl-CoA hydratase